MSTWLGGLFGSRAPAPAPPPQRAPAIDPNAALARREQQLRDYELKIKNQDRKIADAQEKMKECALRNDQMGASKKRGGGAALAVRKSADAFAPSRST